MYCLVQVLFLIIDFKFRNSNAGNKKFSYVRSARQRHPSPVNATYQKPIRQSHASVDNLHRLCSRLTGSTEASTWGPGRQVDPCIAGADLTNHGVGPTRRPVGSTCVASSDGWRVVAPCSAVLDPMPPKIPFQKFQEIPGNFYVLNLLGNSREFLKFCLEFLGIYRSTFF